MRPIPRITCAAVLFDMDGVLLDSRPVVERTWHRWADRHGLSAEPFLRIAHGRRTWDTLRAVAPALATEEEVAWLDAAELEDFDGIRPVRGANALVASLPPSDGRSSPLPVASWLRGASRSWGSGRRATRSRMRT